MIRAFVRSLTFNIAFYIYTAACCLVLVFAFLLPRKAAFTFVQMLYFRGIAWVERIFLGLDYRVEGRENLPREGSYILAVKHYSTYETLKMPVIFGDIAISTFSNGSSNLKPETSRTFTATMTMSQPWTDAFDFSIAASLLATRSATPSRAARVA